MEVFGILAEANAPAVIKAEPISTTTSTTVQVDPNSGAKVPPKAQSPYSSLLFGGLLLVLMYFVMFRGPRKRQQQQQQMMKALKKNDRVQTIGGIFGTILEVTDTEVVLKIDEANNTKIRVLPSAVAKVIEQK